MYGTDGVSPVLLRVRLLERLAEEVELELAAHHRREAERARPLELGLEHLARRGRDRRAVVPLHVAEHERRRLEPRDPAERRHVGPDVEVAVALLPARDRVARAPGPSPSRARAGSCSPPPRARRPSPRGRTRRGARLPISRPCMSVNATTTVSIAPASTSARSSSKLSMRRSYSVRTQIPATATRCIGGMS